LELLRRYRLGEVAVRGMTKSALRVARDALATGEAALPTCGSRYSRHDYTRPQLFALLALRQFLRSDYRGVVALVAEWRELREAALGLTKVPHYSTLAHAASCLLAGAEKRARSSTPRPR
jgi:hypothetical protein